MEEVWQTEWIEGSLIQTAHARVRSAVEAGDTVLDATLGNGHDTLFLAECVGPDGLVIGFDIQPAALDASRERLLAAGVDASCFRLHLQSHAKLAERVDGSLSAVMFNLGYLPGADKSLITHEATTLTALDAAVGCLCAGGLLSVMCYPGHPGGEREAEQVRDWFAGRSEEFDSLQWVRRSGARAQSPFLLIGQKTDS